MLLILFSWLGLFCVSFLFGEVFWDFLPNVRARWDLKLVLGLVMLAVYAEVFSLFYKVGLAAWCVLGVICLFLLLMLLKQQKQLQICISKKVVLQGILILLVCIYGALCTNLAVKSYDTYLYHAQSIHWIEEYGVVKGLGNLHSRFAYNSSFLCLQALFSFKWLFGVSVHSINGYIYVLMLVYCVSSARLSTDRLLLSDFFRMILLLYILSFDAMSSPTPDFCAICISCYTVIKLVEVIEDDVDDMFIFYPILAIAAWALTIKLLALMLVVIAIIPIYLCFKNRAWNMILYLCLMMVGIILPWLIRNIIISGYVLYPYPELDIFHFDWKMPNSICLDDRLAITYWARVRDKTELWGCTIRQWFPVWFRGNPIWSIPLLILDIPCIIVDCIWVLKCFLRDKKWKWSVLWLALFLTFILWFIGAPDVRFGFMAIFVFPVWSIWLVAKNIFSDSSLLVRKGIITSLISCICLFGVYEIYAKGPRCIPMEYMDYKFDVECNVYQIDGVDFFVPQEGDQVDYYQFPSTPYMDNLKHLRLKSTSIKGGFKYQ